MHPNLVRLATALFMIGGAAAQDTAVVLSMEGWSQEDRNGTMYYRCDSSLCDARSRVSYRRQTHRPDLPMAMFEAHHRRLSADASKGEDSQVRSASIRDFSETKVEGVRVLMARRDVVWKSGNTTSHIDALLIGARSYSVVSDARQPDEAMRNFKGFLPRLVDLALLTL